MVFMGIKFNYEDSFVGKDEMENLKAFVRVSHEIGRASCRERV